MNLYLVCFYLATACELVHEIIDIVSWKDPKELEEEEKKERDRLAEEEEKERVKRGEEERKGVRQKSLGIKSKKEGKLRNEQFLI